MQEDPNKQALEMMVKLLKSPVERELMLCCPDRPEPGAFWSIVVPMGMCSGQLYSGTKTQSMATLETRQQK